MPITNRAARRFAVFLVLVALTGGFAVLRLTRGMPFTPEAVRDAIRSWGILAPLIFTCAFVIRPFVFFPSTLLFLAGGLAFGVARGTLYAAIGATLGGVVGFGIARLLGHEFVEGLLGNRLKAVHQDRWGAGIVFVLNLIPVIPVTAINYGAGLSGMDVVPFTVAVAAGLTPRAFAYSYFGNSLLHVGSEQFVIAVLLLAALLVIPSYLHRHILKRSQLQRVG